MSDDRGAVGSSAPFSEQEVERTRRLALSRLDELETSFDRVSERLVSVEARLGELAEDLRVRVAALQQQTRDAVAASLQMLAPQRETTDIAAGLDEIRAVVRADVQEIAASIRNTFVETERRLLEEQASFLERAGGSGEGLDARTETLAQAVESLRQQIAATGGTDEVRASVEALREEVAASSGTEGLRSAIESLRGEVTAATSVDDVRQAIEAVRGEMAASKESEELRAAIAAIRQEIADSGDDRDVRDAVEGLRQDLAGQMEQIRITVSEAGPQVDLTERLGAFQEELRAMGESVRDAVAMAREGAGAAAGGTGGLEGTAAGLTSAIAGLREQLEEVARRTEAIDQRSATVEERAVSIEERLFGDAGESGARFALALESALSTVERHLGEFREHLEGAVRSLGERPDREPAEGVDLGALDERLGHFREEMERSVNVLNVQTASQLEQVQGEIEGWMTRFGDVLESSLDTLREGSGRATGGSADDVRSEVGAMAKQVQEQMNRLEASLDELREGIAFAGTGPEARGPEAQPEPPPTTQAQPAEEPATAPAVEPEVEEPPEEPPEETPEETPEGTAEDAEVAVETREGEEEEAPTEPTEADVGHKKLPDIWSWGPKQG